MKAIQPEVERELRELHRVSRERHDFIVSVLAEFDRRLAEIEHSAIRTPYELPELEDAA